MTIGRLAGDRLTVRVGRARIVRIGALLAAAGLSAALRDRPRAGGARRLRAGRRRLLGRGAAGVLGRRSSGQPLGGTRPRRGDHRRLSGIPRRSTDHRRPGAERSRCRSPWRSSCCSRSPGPRWPASSPSIRWQTEHMHRQRARLPRGVAFVCLHASVDVAVGADGARDVRRRRRIGPVLAGDSEYPQIAQAARVQGVVVVALTVARRWSRPVSHDRARHPVAVARRPRPRQGQRLHLSRLHRSDALSARVPLPVRRSPRAGGGMRAIITSTSGTLPIAALPRIMDAVTSDRRASDRALEHAGQEP